MGGTAAHFVKCRMYSYSLTRISENIACGVSGNQAKRGGERGPHYNPSELFNHGRGETEEEKLGRDGKEEKEKEGALTGSDVGRFNVPVGIISWFV